MTMPTLFKRASGSIPQSSSHESCTLPPLVVNTVAKPVPERLNYNFSPFGGYPLGFQSLTSDQPLAQSL